MEEPDAPEPAADPRPWSLPRRFLFRLGLVYFLLYTHPFPLNVVPDPRAVLAVFEVEWPLEHLTNPVFEGLAWYSQQVTAADQALVDWTAATVFGFGQILDRPLGSGDPTYSYVRLALFLALSTTAAILWTAVARGNRGHRRLGPWLHLAGRYALALPMLGYGFAKVFPSQFRAPSLARLVSDYGDSSPMNVLWTFMGSSAPYTVFAGAGEVLAGVLLCFRRTSTLGALVAAAVMTNVVALNFSYDVPVKLYSSHLLLLALLLALPDARRLAAAFLANRPVAARDMSAPRLPLFSGHLVKLLVVGTTFALGVERVYRSYTTPTDPGTHFGIWDVERFAALEPDGDERAVEPPWHALLIERETNGVGFGWIQLADHTLRGARPQWRKDDTQLTLSGSSVWAWEQEGDRLVLRGEFQRTFREQPRDFASPGTPRAPQVERELRRVGRPGPVQIQPVLIEAAVVDARPEAPADAEDGEAKEDDDALPPGLVGRWELVRDAFIGDTYTSRRQDPAGWIAVTIGPDGRAEFEDGDGGIETYAATHDDERGLLTFAWESEFEVEQTDPEAMVLRGSHRGQTIEVSLRRRDPDAYLLVRRGFNWINELPLNRF